MCHLTADRMRTWMPSAVWTSQDGNRTIVTLRQCQPVHDGAFNSNVSATLKRRNDVWPDPPYDDEQTDTSSWTAARGLQGYKPLPDQQHIRS